MNCSGSTQQDVKPRMNRRVLEGGMVTPGRRREVLVIKESHRRRREMVMMAVETAFSPAKTAVKRHELKR